MHWGTGTSPWPMMEPRRKVPPRLRDGVHASTATLLERALIEAATTGGAAGRALRVEVPVRGLDAWSWLDAQTGPEKVYWSDRDGAFSAAGLGCADRFEIGPGADRAR